MGRKALRIFGFAVLGFLVLDFASCRLYDAVTPRKYRGDLPRSTVTSSNGYTVSYIAASTDVARTSPRIVYVHGTPGSAANFENYLTTPVPGFYAVSLDRPGFGYTTPRKPVFTLAEQAATLEPLLTNNPILVGHSLGGPIIVEAALRFPDRVGGLVILSGCLDPALEKITWYQRLASFPVIPYMIPYFLRNSNHELLPLKAELEAMRPRLKKLRCPIVIVHAPDDILVPYANVDYMLRQFPANAIVDVMRLEGKSHWVPWNAEVEVREAIARVARAMELKAPAAAPEEE